MGVSATVGFFGSAMMSPLILMIGDAVKSDKASDREVGRGTLLRSLARKIFTTETQGHRVKEKVRCGDGESVGDDARGVSAGGRDDAAGVGACAWRQAGVAASCESQVAGRVGAARRADSGASLAHGRA